MTGLTIVINYFFFQGGTWEISTHKRDLTELSALLYENSFALDFNGLSVTRDRGHAKKLVCLQFLLLAPPISVLLPRLRLLLCSLSLFTLAVCIRSFKNNNKDFSSCSDIEWCTESISNDAPLVGWVVSIPPTVRFLRAGPAFDSYIYPCGKHKH